MSSALARDSAISFDGTAPGNFPGLVKPTDTTLVKDATVIFVDDMVFSKQQSRDAAS